MSETTTIDQSLWITSDEAMHDACHNFWGDKRHRHVDIVRPVLAEGRLWDWLLESGQIEMPKRTDQGSPQEAAR